MTTGQGNIGLAADRTIFYTRFMAVVNDAYLGPGSSLVIWHAGNPPPYPPANLGPQAFPTSDPATTIVQGSNFDSAQVAAIFNALATFAQQMTRYRIYTYTYNRTPGPATVVSNLTAFDNGYLSVASIPTPAIPAVFNLGAKIQLDPATNVDPFMTALYNSLVTFRATAANQVNGTFCHTSCHSSCHGARGRR